MIRKFDSYIKEELDPSNKELVNVPDLSVYIGWKWNDNMIAKMRGLQKHLEIKLLFDKIGKSIKFLTTKDVIITGNLDFITINTEQHVERIEEPFWSEQYILDEIKIFFFVDEILYPVKHNQIVQVIKKEQKFTEEDPYGEEEW